MVTRNHILSLTKGLKKDGADISTLATPFDNLEAFKDPNQVKVVLDAEGFALFFSRYLHYELVVEGVDGRYLDVR